LVSENIDISYECCVMGLEELANHGIQNPSWCLLYWLRNERNPQMNDKVILLMVMKKSTAKITVV
jgi:hypothetical protein